MIFNKVKGTTDWFPEEKELQQKVFEVLRTTAKRFAFREVESSVMEQMGVLTAKSGEEAASQIFTLDTRGKEDLGLRFDLTIPLTRMFVVKQQELQMPVRWFCLDKMWRYERPQKGRQREFYQLSAELFGSNTPEAVAECINLVIACLNKLGLRKKDFFVRFNNRKLLEGLIAPVIKKGQLEAVTRIIDKTGKIAKEEQLKELISIGLKSADAKKVLSFTSWKGEPATILEKVKKEKLNVLAKQGLKEVEQLAKILPKEYAVLDLSIVRGLAYYTGTVFEFFDREEKFRALAGGGQYDGLTELLGGKNGPAVGFGLGLSTLLLVLEKKKLLPVPKVGPDYYIVIVSPDVKDEAFVFANQLRKQCSVDIDLLGRKVKKQLNYANSIGAKTLIVIGPDELKSKKVKVKNLATGKEKTVTMASLI